jgi:predicted ATPase
MITKIKIENLRSIKNAVLPLGKITVLTGANNSGKSSILYGIMALKNIVNNPYQSIDNCLTPGFINLGGFKETVHLKDERLNIGLGIDVAHNQRIVSYDLSIGKVESSITLSSENTTTPIQMKLDIAFPYPGNKEESLILNEANSECEIDWNGMVVSASSNGELPSFANKLVETLSSPVAHIHKMDFVPLRRGFTKPYFSPVPLQAQIYTEDEIATLLANDRDLAGRVAHYLEMIVDRSFSVYSTPGIGNFYLQTRDRTTSFTADLVNEGLGTNQLVTILAKVLQNNNEFICIDEPEIHLHPSIIDRLVTTLIEIAEKEGKQFLVSTHSEHFISSLLARVADGKMAHSDVQVYYLTKDHKETVIENQPVNEQGQIQGGLKNFYTAELTNMQSFFKITD